MKFPKTRTAATAGPPNALRAVALFASALLAGAPEGARAADENQQPAVWGVSGFGTLGVVSQAGGGNWGLIRAVGQAGARQRTSLAEDSRAGVQLNWRSGPKWEAVVQAVVLNRPNNARTDESVEWAYLGYRPTPELRVRLGRMSPDMFLFADTRNVGFALPWVRPPVDFYGFAPLAPFDGVDLEWQHGGPDATWRARLAAGRFRTATVDSTSGATSSLIARNASALTLARESEALTLKLSYVRAQVNNGTSPADAQFQQALAQFAALPVPGVDESVRALQDALAAKGPVSYLAFGLQYETGPWSLYTEASDLHTFGSTLSSRRAYISVGFRTGHVTVYGLLSRSQPRNPVLASLDLASPLTPVIGPDAAAQAQQLATLGARAAGSLRSHQHTAGVGLRWDVSPHAALKFQIDRSHVFANGSGSWLYGDGRPARITLASVALDFAWGQ